MKELSEFLKRCLSDKGEPSYTRCAGFTTLYFYLLWATFKISSGVPIKDVDMPVILAGFLFGLYGVGKVSETVTAVKGAANVDTP
jgi:hypothetical protein